MTPEAHDGVIKWKHFSRYWPFVRGIHRSTVNSPHEGQWRGALVFSLICAWINGWINNRKAGDLRRHRAHPSWRHRNVIMMMKLCGNLTVTGCHHSQSHYFYFLASPLPIEGGRITEVQVMTDNLAEGCIVCQTQLTLTVARYFKCGLTGSSQRIFHIACKNSLKIEIKLGSVWSCLLELMYAHNVLYVVRHHLLGDIAFKGSIL